MCTSIKNGSLTVSGGWIWYSAQRDDTGRTSLKAAECSVQLPLGSSGALKGTKTHLRWEAFHHKMGRFVLGNTVCAKKKGSWGYNRALRLKTLPHKSFSLQAKWWVCRWDPFTPFPFCTLRQERAHKQCEILLHGIILLQNTVIRVTSGSLHLLCTLLSLSTQKDTLTLQYSGAKFSLLLPI